MTVVLGLASRRYRASLPPFVGEYAGDTLWAAMAYFGLSILTVSRPIGWRATVALAFCFAIETSQLFHRPWLDAIRDTTPGGLVLGRGFLVSDLLCYAAGVGGAAAAEWALRRRATAGETA